MAVFKRPGRRGVASRARVVDQRALWGFLFVLPAVLFKLVFSVYPMINAFYLSLTRYTLLAAPRFIGLRHYKAMVHDQRFLIALKNTFFFAGAHTVPTWIIALVLGLIFARQFRGKELLRTMYFVPNVISGVVVALVWQLLYHPDGLMNVLLSPFLGGRRLYWLTDSSLAPWAIVAMSVWQAIGYYMIIFTAGIQDIPHVFSEAARVDGANRWQIFRHITLPLLRPTMAFVVVISMINAFKTFTYQYVMTQGGPGDATNVIALHIYYNGFTFLNMGKASAQSLVMFAIIIAFTFVQLRLIRSEEVSYV